MNNNEKDKLETTATSSADNVDSHLQTLEGSAQAEQQRQHLIEEQLFTEQELAALINPKKLAALMSSGDDLVKYLTSEIDKFED